MMLIFVYNANSGSFNALIDIARRVFSPQTYPCNLCAITYSATGMRREWSRFLRGLDTPFEFLHRDEFNERYDVDGVILPAVFKRNGRKLTVLIDAEAINSCQNLEDLIQLVKSKI